MPLNNAVTADAYTPTATERFSRPQRTVSFTILDAVVYVQFALASPPGQHAAGYGFELTERRLIPGHWGFSVEDWEQFECVGFRFRSAVSGQHAHISSQ